MVSDLARRVGLSATIFGACAVAASLLWHIPYIFTVIVLLGLGLVGFVVTLDDDPPQGQAQHPGGRRAAVAQLAVVVCVLAAVIVAAVFFPSVRALGGS